MDPAEQMMPLLVENADDIDEGQLFVMRPSLEITHESRMNQEVELVARYRVPSRKGVLNCGYLVVIRYTLHALPLLPWDSEPRLGIRLLVCNDKEDIPSLRQFSDLLQIRNESPACSRGEIFQGFDRFVGRDLSAGV